MKGQVIMPASVLKARDWRAGARLVVEDTADGVLLEAAPLFAPTRAEDVFGSLPYSGKPKTIKEMNAAILAEARRRYVRD